MRKDETPLVSAIITTHNRLDFLKRAVKSVLNQTYKKIECIIVNDASSDGTNEWLSTLNNENIIKICIPESLGGNHARNEGIKKSKGKFCAFLDDDDFWMPEKVEKQMQAIFSFESSGVCLCGLYKTDGKEVYITRSGGDIINVDYSSKIFTGVPAVTSSLIIRKDLLLAVGMFDERVKYWQEYELLIRLSQLTMFVELNEPLVIYWDGKREKAKLTNKLDGFEENFHYITDKHYRRIDTLENEKKEQWYIHFYYDAAIRYYRLGDKIGHKRMLYEVWKIHRTVKNYIRYILNISYFSLLRFHGNQHMQYTEKEMHILDLINDNR